MRGRQPPLAAESARAVLPHGGSGGVVHHRRLAVLDEANVLGVLAEALPADVHAVLADETALVGAHAAAEREQRGAGGVRLGMQGQGPSGTAAALNGILRCNYASCSSYSPLAGALAVLLGVGVPHSLVTHDEFGRLVALKVRFNHRAIEIALHINKNINRWLGRGQAARRTNVSAPRCVNTHPARRPPPLASRPRDYKQPSARNIPSSAKEEGDSGPAGAFERSSSLARRLTQSEA